MKADPHLLARLTEGLRDFETRERLAERITREIAPVAKRTLEAIPAKRIYFGKSLLVSTADVMDAVARKFERARTCALAAGERIPNRGRPTHAAIRAQATLRKAKPGEEATS